jgi:hypothetical protein
MKTKKCGNCEFWDRENAMNSYFANRKLAQCKFPVPICVPKTMVYEDQGAYCPLHVHKENS